MKFGSRGQAAMEYLMTYGWAILVVMVVGIAMWQLGIFSMGSSSVSSTGWAKIKPQLAACGLGRDGEFKGIFTNGLGTLMYADTENAVIRELGSGSECATVEISPVTVSAGRNFKVSASGCATGLPGEVYDLQFSIPYDVVVGNVQSRHSEFGTIRGPFE